MTGGALAGDGDAWGSEWLRVCANPCALSSPAAGLLLAGNSNTPPRSPLARQMWADAPFRPILARSWGLRGLDTHLDLGTRRVSVLVKSRAVSEPEAPDWLLLECEFVYFEVDEADLSGSLLSHVSVCAGGRYRNQVYAKSKTGKNGASSAPTRNGS